MGRALAKEAAWTAFEKEKRAEKVQPYFPLKTVIPLSPRTLLRECKLG